MAYHTLPIASVYIVHPKLLLCLTLLATLITAASGANFPATGPTVPGNMARLVGKLAAAPQNAPLIVKKAIWAPNQLRSKPYRFGGGHKSFLDSAYDCSGTVSYAL